MSVTYNPALADLFTPASAVTPHPRNPRNGDVEAIISSVRANGCYRPVYASRASGRIVAGHHLYAALLTLDEENIPVQWVENLTDEDELRIVLADNKVAELGWMDDGLVVDVLDDIGTDGTGYTHEELLEMKAELASGFSGAGDPEPDEDFDDVGAVVTCPNCQHVFTTGGQS